MTEPTLTITLTLHDPKVRMPSTSGQVLIFLDYGGVMNVGYSNVHGLFNADDRKSYLEASHFAMHPKYWAELPQLD